MKTNYVPAIVMLSAGFVDCIFAIVHHLNLLDFTKELLIVLIVFLLIGCVIKIILDRSFKSFTEGQEETNENKTDEKTENDTKGNKENDPDKKEES